MRLTLRAMLNYMDDVLDPQDAEMIAKKIEESEFATQLLHRTREVMRRLRLGAPNVHDRGVGLDPNTVAEYLDNTLDDSRVPDFEKVCLESDIHLAEVASCHQVLALVLGEPAEVDPDSRQRMYHLPETLSAQAKREPLGPPKLPEPIPGDHHRVDGGRPPKHAEYVIPEYLRPPVQTRWVWPAVAGAAALLLVAVIALAITGHFEPGTPLGKLLAFGPGIGSETQPPETEPTGLGQEVGETKDLTRTDKSARSDVAPEPSGPPPAAAKTPTDQPVAALPSETGTQALATPPASQPSKPLQRPGVPAAAATGASIPAVEPTVPVVKETQPPAANPLRGPGAEPRPKAAPDLKGNTTEPEPGTKSDMPEPTDRAPMPVEKVGRLLSPTLLLKLDADAAVWQRVAPETMLTSQDRLLSLPAFRPAILLAAQIRLELIDGTRVDLQPVDAQGVPGLAVDYGRLILKAEWKEKSRVRLQVGNRIGVITFTDADSAVAIQMSRARTPGVDPETQPPLRVADLYVTTGKVVWQEAGGAQPIAVNAPVRLTLNDRPLEPVAVQQFPKWIGSDTTSALDQRAAPALDREIQGRPIALALRELADHRQREVRWLAMRCLGYLGDFGPIVTALNDPDQKQVWPEYVEQLREGVVRSPETAAAIRTAMEKPHGAADGAGLYELLWRYPDDRLTAQEAAALIRCLDHEMLSVRVVAFWGNLKRITNLSLYYRPEEPSAKRQSSIARWKERLKAGWPPGAPAVKEKESPPRPGSVESSSPAKPSPENAEE